MNPTRQTRQELEEKKGFWKRLGICMTIGFVIISILWNVFDANLRSQNTQLQSQITELKQNQLCHYVNQTGDYNMTCEDAMKIPPSPISYSPNRYLYDCHSLNDSSLLMICKLNLSEVIPQ